MISSFLQPFDEIDVQRRSIERDREKEGELLRKNMLWNVCCSAPELICQGLNSAGMPRVNGGHPR